MTENAGINRDRLLRLVTVFLDRDGVVNEKMPEGQYVTSREEFHLLPGVADAISRLNRAGIRVILVSNQRGIALGLYTAEDVDAIHVALQASLESFGGHLDGIYYCPHNNGECDCRKPLPGLFKKAAVNFPGLEAQSSIMIGDSLSDIEFGRRLGMSCVFIEGDPMRCKPGSEEARQIADLSCRSLAAAVDLLLEGRVEATTIE